MTKREDVIRLVRTLAAYPVLPPAEALPPNDEVFQGMLADLAQGEGSSDAPVLREVSTESLISVDELCRRARFLLSCLLLPTSGTYYDALGLSADAPTREIRKRWAVLIRRYHPDGRGGGAGRSGWLDERARRLIEAYQTLKDPERRRQYDAQLRGGAVWLPAVSSNLPELRVTRSKGPATRRLVTAGIAAVGIAAGVWAHTRPAPGPLPNAPLPAAPKLLEAWGSSGPSRIAVPVGRATEAAPASAQKFISPSPYSGEWPAPVPSVVQPPVLRMEVIIPPGQAAASPTPSVSSVAVVAAELSRPPPAGTARPEPEGSLAVRMTEGAWPPAVDARPNASPTTAAAIATLPVARATTSPVGTTGAAPARTSPGLAAEAAAPEAGRAPSSSETLALIEAFRAAYERKDLAAMMVMFAAEPRDRDVAGRREVQQLYAHNFATLDQIRYELSELEIRAGRGDGEMLVRGQYRIRAVRPRNASQPIDVTGPIRWLLRRESDALRVVAVEYEDAR
jgi:ketosteroid isomerase-like protein